MKFIAIDREGRPEEPIELTELAESVAQGNRENYERNGFQKPWCAYFVELDGDIVGSCAFKTPVRDGRVEIAYFTFPEFEGKGIATQMARQLVQIARAADPKMIVTAQTLPVSNASTSILKKIGFTKTATVNHPEDGEVWEWTFTRG